MSHLAVCNTYLYENKKMKIDRATLGSLTTVMIIYIDHSTLGRVSGTVMKYRTEALGIQSMGSVLNSLRGLSRRAYKQHI